MAKMKSDVAQMYYDEHGTTLRDRLIRDSPKMAGRFSGPFAATINRLQRTGVFRNVMERLAGFDQRRTLPAYAPEPFLKALQRRKNGSIKSERKVVLFVDTYVNFHEPNIGLSAVELLESCGYEVLIANVGCCQRTKISHGFLRDAKRDGAKTVEGLKPYLDAGLPIVVCEPSCASALNDDLPDLLADEVISAKLKNQVKVIDAFLADEVEGGILNHSFQAVSDNLAIHGHCHQKALYGTAGLKTMLSLSNADVREIPSGCCGMAGSFGYEKEHYDISKKIGELLLFPAVRGLKKGTTLVANGFSCRHQIEHFTGVKGRHWVEVIRVKK